MIDLVNSCSNSVVVVGANSTAFGDSLTVADNILTEIDDNSTVMDNNSIVMDDYDSCPVQMSSGLIIPQLLNFIMTFVYLVTISLSFVSRTHQVGVVLSLVLRRGL
jgi:hypothetical protein